MKIIKGLFAGGLVLAVAFLVTGCGHWNQPGHGYGYNRNTANIARGATIHQHYTGCGYPGY